MPEVSGLMTEKSYTAMALSSGTFSRMSFSLEREKIEGLGGALINGRFLDIKAQVVAQGHLKSELLADNHESRRS